MGILYCVAPPGNIGLTCNLGIAQSSHPKLIIMDADSTFAPGAVQRLYAALDHSLVAKPQIVYQTDTGVSGSQIVARSRDYINRLGVKAFAPGLALHRDLETQIGYLFHNRVRWAEDAELDYRIQRHHIPIFYVPEAIIYHSPVHILHDLRAAFRLGYGKRLGVEQAGRIAEENVRGYLARLLRGEQIRFVLDVAKARGIAVSAYMALWSFVYYAGYYAQRISNAWAVSYPNMIPMARQEELYNMLGEGVAASGTSANSSYLLDTKKEG
jgi:glycosyltransferase involved in cell wall biosynthesis